MNVPLVSIGVITYNHGNYIRQCLEGIMMQNVNFQIEVIIGEDCSTDNTRAVVKEFEEKYPNIIRAVYHEKNVGGARNAYEFCYPLLKGKYIAICEGDDFWTDPYKLQKQVDYLEANPDCVISYHRIKIINDQDELMDTPDPSEKITKYSKKDIIHLKIPTLSVVYRNCIKVDFQEMMRVKSGDTFLFGMLSKHGGAADMGFVGATYRKHGGGVYSSLPVIEQYKQAIKTLRLMKSSPSFDRDQKNEIDREVMIRKKRYIRKFIYNKEIMNSLRIMFT